MDKTTQEVEMSTLKRVLYKELAKTNAGYFSVGDGFLPGLYDPTEYLTCKECCFCLRREGHKGREYYCCHKQLRDKTSRNSYKTIIGKKVNCPIKVAPGIYMENKVMRFFPACPFLDPPQPRSKENE